MYQLVQNIIMQSIYMISLPVQQVVSILSTSLSSQLPGGQDDVEVNVVSSGSSDTSLHMYVATMHYDSEV